MTTLVRRRDVPVSPPVLTLGEPDRFDGRIRTLELGELVVAEVRADTRQEHRAPRLGARHTAAPHYLLTMPVRGRCVVEQHGRQARLDPFDLALHDTARPSSVLAEDGCRMLTLTFPGTPCGCRPIASPI
ncbi:hypothetical protein ACFQ9X_15720 [Catenulispora yoronensis]